MDRYTDSDLVRLYKGCKHPARQINILCQLSCRKRSDVVKALLAAGLEVPVGNTGRKLWTEEEVAKLIQLRRQGATNREIADQLGRCIGSVHAKAARISV